MNLGCTSTTMLNFIFVLFLCFNWQISCSILKDECQAFGYNPAVLTCETCEHMHKILDHQATYTNCRACCIEKVEEIYNLAVLEVDKRYLHFMKEISAVIDKKKDLQLKVRYRYGNPTLYMYKEKGDIDPAESIAVGSWDKNTFEEYLTTHVRGNIEAKAKAASKS